MAVRVATTLKALFDKLLILFLLLLLYWAVLSIALSEDKSTSDRTKDFYYQLITLHPCNLSVISLTTPLLK